MKSEEQIAHLLMLMGAKSVPIYDQFDFHDRGEGGNMHHVFSMHSGLNNLNDIGQEI